MVVFPVVPSAALGAVALGRGFPVAVAVGAGDLAGPLDIIR